MDPYIYGLYSLAYMFLFLWGLKLSIKYGFFTWLNVLLLVTFGLIYDNLVLSLGSMIGEGPILKGLNVMRYWFHAFFTPLLIIFSWSAIIRKKGIHWLNERTGFLATGIFTIAMIIAELMQNTIGLKLEPSRNYGVLSYEAAGSHGPPIMIIGVTFALLLAGFILWKKLQWKWMAVGVILMGIGSAVPIPLGSDAATNGFELILLISLWATKAFLEKKSEQAA
ncbi:phospholipid phosphatase [Mesobacillus subterraneus]|uniref:phospholipid phosphatase n=1 Tax=Mesobacillus subterraneus TaxID=285983 RepID=UPI001CFDAC36|nr:phospholipid phosphatase [Mesobacillus subterraneus]